MFIGSSENPDFRESIVKSDFFLRYFKRILVEIFKCSDFCDDFMIKICPNY